MITYGFSITGKSHIARGTGCQDAHEIRKLENGWYIAAVADGVGSAEKSHIGARIAVDTVIDFCEDCMPYDYNQISIKSMIRTAYNYALKKIMREAQAHGEAVELYDTTLSMVIYDGQRIIYGHSGDGAILGLTRYGKYIEITTPQKGLDMISVMPLRAGYAHWVINSCEEDLAAVILVTDGMLETLSPYLLKFAEQQIYIPLAMMFADPYCFAEKTDLSELKAFITAESTDKEQFYGRFLRALAKRLSSEDKAAEVCDRIKENDYPLMLMDNQQDDKTVVGLINPEAELENQDGSYYDEPDWAHLQELWNQKAYPHLYEQESADTELVNEVMELDHDGEGK